jgi:polar amino acid transport system substrate-binding protein
MQRYVFRFVFGFVFGLVAAAFALLSPALARAEAQAPVLARIVESGTLRVGMSGDQPPLNFKGKDGKIMGLEVDLARALATLMAVELRIVQKPFEELLGALEKGEVDLVMSGMTITPERNMKAAFVGPYYLSGKSILTKSSTLAKADETEDLDQSNLTLAALAGSTSQRFVETLLPKAKLVTTATYEEAVKLLLEDKVQAMVADQEIVKLTAFRYPEQKLATLTRPLTVEPIGVAVPPGDALLVNFLENTLGAFEASDLLRALQVRWLEQGDWVEQLP